jgi:seryl-tRNA synthetase
LEDAATKLQAKGDSLVKSLVEEAKRSLKSKAVKDLYAQTKALDPEYQALDEKVRQNTDAMKKSTDDLQRLPPRQAELSDEIAIEEINVETFSHTLDELNWQITTWYSMAIGSMLIGFVMMVLGFWLWYKKVQVHQDAILRKQAGDIKGTE